MMEASTPGRSVYDQEFTYSRIGMAQRAMVWRYMEGILRTPGMEILELNCGTGVDAVHMAKQGHHVLATDISEEMLRVARDTARQHGVEEHIMHERLSFDELRDRPRHASFHMVFSDFGGLNYLDEAGLKEMCDPIADRLEARGRFIAVLMPDRCLSETVHAFLHGHFREAFKRGRHDPVWAGMSGSGVHTWYHSPRRMAAAFAPRFALKAVRPVGFFLPPSHLDAQFVDRPKVIDRLARWDERVSSWRWTARYADHYLIDLEKRA